MSDEHTASQFSSSILISDLLINETCKTLAAYILLLHFIVHFIPVSCDVMGYEAE